MGVCSSILEEESAAFEVPEGLTATTVKTDVLLFPFSSLSFFLF